MQPYRLTERMPAIRRGLEFIYSLAKHPAPHREKIGLGALLYSLFAAPIVWAGDLIVASAADCSGGCFFALSWHCLLARLPPGHTA